MKIALIGYGAMGKLIGTLAEEKGLEITVVVDDADAGLSAAEIAAKVKEADVAIDFTVAAAVKRNIPEHTRERAHQIQNGNDIAAHRAGLDVLEIRYNEQQQTNGDK